MTSLRKIAANRANALHSTGPRSAAGKMSSRRNSFKHGLAVSAAAIPELAQEIIKLADDLAGYQRDQPLVLAAATRVAEATVNLLRVRRARVELLEEVLQNSDVPQPPQQASQTAEPQVRRRAQQCRPDWEKLDKLDRYERRALSQRRAAIKAFDELSELPRAGSQE